MRMIGDMIPSWPEKLIESESLKNAYQKVLKNSVMITGPKGVGKTTSLLFCFSKLRGNNPRIFISTKIMDKSPSTVWTDFVKSSLSAGIQYNTFFF